MTTYVIGVDAGTPALQEADHLLAELVRGLGLPEGGAAATHLIRTGTPRVALSLTVSDPSRAAGLLPPGARSVVRDEASAQPDDGASQAALAHGMQGRVVVFPGVDRLTGTLTVGEVLERSAIDEVAVLLGDPPAPETRLHTRDHVRPEWRDGRLTLLTMPAGPGRLAPYEVPDPTPCCAAHH